MRRVLCRLGLHDWRRRGTGGTPVAREIHLQCTGCQADRVDQDATVSGWRIHSNPPGTSG